LGVSVRKARQTRRVLAPTKGFDEVEKNEFPVAPHDIVHVVGPEAHVVVLGRKVTTPHDGQTGIPGLEPSADGDGVSQLGPGHDGHAQHIGARLPNGPVQGGPGVGLQVTVHDDVIVAALQNGPQGQKGQG
jgi:hypothetical protein